LGQRWVGVGAGGTVTSSPAACVAEDDRSVKASTQAGANLERVRVGIDRSPKKNLQLLNVLIIQQAKKDFWA